MAAGMGIRAHIAADSILQDEINRGLALLATAAPLPFDPRLVRILARVIEASWTEHVSFQENVVFPIVAAEYSGTNGVSLAIDDLCQEHRQLSVRHAEVRLSLGNLQREGDTEVRPALRTLMAVTIAERNRHFDAEDVVAEHIPAIFAVADVERFEAWRSGRAGLPFPVGIFARQRLSGRKAGSSE